VIPLVVDGRTVGVVWLGRADATPIAEEDRALLVAAAGQSAQAFERVRLHEETARAARWWAFLAEASSALDELQGSERRAQRLADLVVMRIADGASVELLTDDERVTLAVAARDPNLRDRHAGAGARLDAAVEQAIATGEPQLLHGPRGDRRSGARAAPLGFAALPLRARGRVLGALTLTSFEPEPRLASEDLPFLSGLADRAALALENARLYEQERAVAETLQQSLLAGEPPRDPRFEVATQYRPAVATLEVGGDWYDTFAVADGIVGIVVGDVVGRGVEAASAMGQLRSAVRALAGAQLGPARLIEHLDAFVERVETARYATLAYVEIELDSGRARFACAGHPPPLLARPGAPARLRWDGRSTPIGAVAGLRTEAAFTLERGARLLLYTDGLFERRDRPLDEGLDRLAEEFERRSDAPLPDLIGGLTEAMLVDEQGHDDVCLLCFSLAAPRRDPAEQLVDRVAVEAEAGERGEPADREVADQREQLLVPEHAGRPAGRVGPDRLAQ
jgi:serine/threonine-protein kinase RsbW